MDFFQGVVGMLDPGRSWVAKWQKQVSAAKVLINGAAAAAAKISMITHNSFPLRLICTRKIAKMSGHQPPA